MKENIEIKKYPNGAKLLVEKNEKASYIAFAVRVFKGAFDENPNEFGVAHFVEHMVFKASKNRTAEQINRELEEYGAVVNAWTSNDSTCFHFKCLKESFDKCAEIYADMLINPLFSQEEMDKERQVILEEFALYKDDPRSDTYRLAETAMLSNFVPNAHQVLGTEEIVKSLTPENLRNFMSRNYIGKNITIAVSGNVTLAEIAPVVEKHFNKFFFEQKTEFCQKSNTGLTPFEPVKVIEKDIAQVNLYCMIKSGKKLGPQHYVQKLYSRILGAGMSSRLFSEVREKLGLAYAVYAYDEGLKDFGMIRIYAGCNPKNLKKATCAIAKVLKDLAETGVTEQELNKAKMGYKSALAYNEDEREEVLQEEALEDYYTNNIRTDEEIINKINNITTKDIQNYAKQILNEKIKIVYASGKNLDKKDLEVLM